MSVIWEPAFDDEVAHWRRIAERLTQAHFAPLAEELDREQRYPHENVRRLVEHKLAGLFVPKAYGGEGASLTRHRRGGRSGRRRLRVDGGDPVRVPARRLSGAAGRPRGSEEILSRRDGQRHHDELRAVGARGRLGRRRASKPPQPARATAGGLRGEKYWIGNGGASRYYVVFAKTDPAAGGRGISAFMVDRDAPGVVIDEYCDKMGIRGTQTSNLKLDTLVPTARASATSIARCGSRSRRSMSGASWWPRSRSVSRSPPIARLRKRAVERRAFGMPIIENQGIGFKLADMATEISAARMMLYEAAQGL